MAENEGIVSQLRLVPKIIGLIVALIVTYIVCVPVISSLLGADLPWMFVEMFLWFAVAGFVLFVLLDVPEMGPQAGFAGWKNIIVTILASSAVLTYAGWEHPQYRIDLEIAKMNRAPIKEMPKGPEAVAAGLAIFEDNKCNNCHKTIGSGSSDRGPDFAVNQIGAYPFERLREMVIDVRKDAPFGFDSAKAKKEMPTYYGEDLGKMEQDLLVVYLQTQVDDSRMPVRGAPGDLKKWEEFDDIVAYGKIFYAGEANEDINCAVCHGGDGIPLMSDAPDLRSTTWASKTNPGKTFADMTDGEWFKSIMDGVEDTAMAGWAEMDMTRYDTWSTIAFIRKGLGK